MIQEKASGVKRIRLAQYSSPFTFQPLYSLNLKVSLITHRMFLHHISDIPSVDKLWEIRVRPELLGRNSDP